LIKKFLFKFSGRELDNEKLICYYQISAVSRDAPMSLSPSSLDPYLCTHIIYYQAKLDDSKYKIIPAIPYFDLDKGK
jgi:hypothetical protein